jgi:hypothetical protein
MSKPGTYKGASLAMTALLRRLTASSGRVALIPFTGGRSKVLVAHGSQASWNG